MAGRDADHSGRARYRGPGRAARWLPPLLVVLLLGSAVAADRYAWGPTYLGWHGTPESPAEVVPPAGLELAAAPPPTAVAEPLVPGTLDAAAVDAAVGNGLRDPDLGRHVVATVADLTGAEPVLTRGTGRVLPASTTKLLTGAAALAALDPSTRFRTTVVTGANPDQVVLVGGGDPYLASSPSPSSDDAAAAAPYPERADVVTLARRTAAALLAAEPDRRRRVRLRYDTSLFTGPVDNPHWRPDYVRDQIVSPIVPLWVDSGRDDSGWGRVPDPAAHAAEVFARALGNAGVRVVGKPRPAVAAAGAEELASVESAPLDQVVQHMLDVSDNEAAEVLAHHVGLATLGEGSFAAGATGTVQVLAGLGVDAAADRLFDGSGLSRDNRIAPRTLLEVLRLGASPEHPELRAVVEGLPVAGFTGSLAVRFGDGAPQGPGRVRAKTGTLTGVHSLAGLVTDVGGNVMVFVLAADKVPADRSLDAREALDSVAASLAACSCGTLPASGGGG